jgi:hypothetical protein
MLKSEADDLLEEITRTQNRLRGRLAGLIESWDLGEKRERAMISTLKSISYDAEYALKQKLHDLA